MRRASLLVALVIALALGACRSGGPELAEPQYGSEPCAGCRKVIDDARFAAQYRLPDQAGTVKSFDDPACLFTAMRAEPVAPKEIRFRSYDGAAWLSPKDVWFARTPTTAAHGSGWAAYPSFAAAQDAVTVAGSGEIQSYEQATTSLKRTS